MTDSTETKALDAAVEAAVEVKKSDRREFRNEAWTAAEVAARLQSLQVTEVPKTADGKSWIKISDLHLVCVMHEVPVSKMVKAIGGDRGMNPPLDPLFEVKYLGKTRYIHPDAQTKGIELLKDPNFAPTIRKPREPESVDPNAPVKEKKVKEPKAKGAKVARPATGEGPAAPDGMVWGEAETK